MTRRARIFVAVVLATVVAACETSALLGPDAAQGIEGLVLLGPLCPVVTPENPCPDQPYQASVDVLDRAHGVVTRVQSGADGRFRVGLEPGLYVLVPLNGDPFPSAAEKAVTVQEGVWASVTINYDPGIR